MDVVKKSAARRVIGQHSGGMVDNARLMRQRINSLAGEVEKIKDLPKSLKLADRTSRLFCYRQALRETLQCCEAALEQARILDDIESFLKKSVEEL